MTIDEFAEELAYHLYFDPLPNTWQQTSVIATSVLQPHMKKGKRLRPFQFVPVAKLPMPEKRAERDQMMADAVVARLLARQKWLNERSGNGRKTNGTS